MVDRYQIVAVLYYISYEIGARSDRVDGTN